MYFIACQKIDEKETRNALFSHYAVRFHSKILTNNQSSPIFMCLNQMAGLVWIARTITTAAVAMASFAVHILRICISDWSIYGKRAELWLHINKTREKICTIRTTDVWHMYACVRLSELVWRAPQIVHPWNQNVTIYHSNWCKWKWNAYGHIRSPHEKKKYWQLLRAFKRVAYIIWAYQFQLQLYKLTLIYAKCFNQCHWH